MNVARRASVIGLTLLLAGCANHYLIHPGQPDARIVTWSAEHTREPLLVRVEGARPPGPGPFPTVIVHPEGGGTARDMHGVVWDLAARGYLALAADYQRFIEGKYRWSLFAWRSPADVKAIVDIARDYPEIDQGRIGLLGFSQGGVFSLLIAAHAPERVQAVVSYYPVTDFPSWLALERRSGLQRFAFRFVRWFFRRESGAESEADFGRMLHEASAYYVAESIHAPVLLVHGERDTTASVEESRRMAERLEAAGKTVSLLVVPNGRHIFNFRDRAQAAMAWDATVAWLDRYVGRAPAPPIARRKETPTRQRSSRTPTMTSNIKGVRRWRYGGRSLGCFSRLRSCSSRPGDTLLAACSTDCSVARVHDGRGTGCPVPGAVRAVARDADGSDAREADSDRWPPGRRTRR